MPYRKIATWTIGLMILGAGLWCLSLTAKSASFALSTGGINGMPIDMRMMAFVSFGIALIFSGLFLFGGVSSVLQGKETQINYTPTLSSLAMAIILIVLSVLAFSEYRATSKISWEESRGLPFSFLTLTEIRGVCSTCIVFWKCRFFEDLNPLVLVIDALIIYFAICVSGQILFALGISGPKRWILRNDQIKENGG